jgi:alpha-1,3-rhamnosyl/mannosyltransferase
MKVAIDARGVEPKLQGVGRHVLNLLMGLSCKESELEFLVFYNNPLSRKLVERSGGQFRGRFQWVKAAAKPGSALESVELPWLLRINSVKLFHDIGTTGLWTGGIPSIVTIHELETLRFASQGATHRIKRLLRNSRLVIAVSSAVADELETHFNISRPKIRVIHNAVDPWYSERCNEKEIRAMRERFRLPERYFLCVTADRPSKNVELVKKTAAGWQGPEHWVFTLEGHDSGKLRHFGLVEDVWLRSLYSACAAVIVPSHYEGFSLPPIEALAAGSLPVVSDIAPHREVLGEVLPPDLFFDPSSDVSLARALRAVLEGGDPLRASVLEKFKAVSERYSFIETAQSVQAVYREALRG